MVHGLTRARTMGPVAEAVSFAGGSLTRVFGHAQIPLTLLDTPDRLILLRDQVALIDAAIREIADPSLPARLSIQTGLTGLGPIGVQVRAAATLGEALARVEVVTPLLLQTATQTGVRRHGTNAFYGYAVAERVASGRQANEILALGYLLGTVRHFLGSTWRPSQAVVTGAHLPGRADVEALFGSELVLGSRAGLVFPAQYLDAPNPSPHDPTGADEALDEPIGDDLAACVAHLIDLNLDEARPSIDGIARRLGLSRRTLQRRLDDAGTRYIDIQQRVMAQRAKTLLAEDGPTIGRIASELGYADASHFTRAFLEWTGITPSRWRRNVRLGARG